MKHYKDILRNKESHHTVRRTQCPKISDKRPYQKKKCFHGAVKSQYFQRVWVFSCPVPSLIIMTGSFLWTKFSTFFCFILTIISGIGACYFGFSLPHSSHRDTKRNFICRWVILESCLFFESGWDPITPNVETQQNYRYRITGTSSG